MDVNPIGLSEDLVSESEREGLDVAFSTMARLRDTACGPFAYKKSTLFALPRSTPAHSRLAISISLSFLPNSTFAFSYPLSSSTGGVCNAGLFLPHAMLNFTQGRFCSNANVGFAL